MKAKSNLVGIFLGILVVTSVILPGSPAASQAPLGGETIVQQSDPLTIVEQPGSRKIPAPAAFRQLALAGEATPDDFIINFIGDWSAEEKNAFNYAASIWSALIDPAVKISIDAYDDASCFYCGGYAYIYINYFEGMPRPNTLYTRAQANHLSGTDLRPSDVDFDIKYAATAYPWYYGTDGNTPLNQVDFVTVILHEIAHGLGLITSVDMGHYGSLYGYPYIYDTFMENGAGEILLDKYPVAFQVYPELKADILSDEIYFDGPQIRVHNQNLPAKLQAGQDVHCTDCTYLEHLHEDFYNNSDDKLMTSTLYMGESFHDPGGIVLGMLADMGWTLSSNLPVLNPLPSQMLKANTQRINAIDLWQFIPEHQSPDTNFSYAITNTPVAGAGVSLHDNRYIDVVPTPGWLGSTQVTVKATNLQGQSASRTFTVVVVSEIYSSFLPSVSR